MRSVISFPAPRAAVTPLAILLAARAPIDQRITGGLLQARGHSVTMAGNGWEVIAACERQAFDTVVVDLHMLFMGGRESARELRFRECYTGGRVRIVGMHDAAFAADADACRAAGIDGLIARPLDPAALFALVEHDEAPAVRWPVDVADILERLDGDTELFAQLALLFLEDSPARLSELNAALSRGDASRLRFVAHALKGTAGNLSAPALFTAAGRLEQCAAQDRLDEAPLMARQVADETARVAAYLREAVVETAALASNAS